MATYAILRAKEKERRSSIVYRSKEREWQAYIQRKDHTQRSRVSHPEPQTDTSAKPSSSAWGHARSMGADEAGGGRRCQWDRKPPGQIPSQHAMAPMAFVVCQLIVPTWPMALVQTPAILRSHLWRSRICLGQECHATVNGGGEAEFFT